MLDTNICSFIMRERPAVVLQRLQAQVEARHRIVVSAVTYAELRYGAIGKKASPRHTVLVDEFVARLDDVMPWDRQAIDETVQVRRQLAELGLPIGANDAAIAGHALAVNCVLVTNNMREFARVPGLPVEDWAASR